jgi:carboxypeptidase Q
MSRSLRAVRRASLALAFAVPALAQQTEKMDLASLAKIRDEGMNRSKVMEITSYLTDVYGARLTGSPATKAAGDWVVGQLKSWGASNPRLESWGPFGRGWSNEKINARVTAPSAYPLIAYPNAWSTSTNGRVSGEVAIVKIDSLSDIPKYKGKLGGKWLMIQAAPDSLVPHWLPEASRMSDGRLDSLAMPQQPQGGGQGRGGPGGGGPGGPGGAANAAARQAAIRALNDARTELYKSEKIAGILQFGRGDGGTVFNCSTGNRAADAPWSPATICLTTEGYGRIARTLAKGIPVKVEAEMANTFYDKDLNSFNIVAELPGTDPRIKDEVVMLGAHFDSWHMGTGATDNVAGSAVMLEAMRILKTTGVPLRRTVRIALWTGEEQGLLGSRAYVRDHFGSRDSTGLHTKPDHEKFSAYFNVDNGTGAIRGVYQQGNEAVGPIFQQWMEPFKDLGMRSLTIRNTGGTDHQSFDGVGLPGFQFIQDPVEYNTRTHHSNQDVYERIQPMDMKKNSIIVASFVFLSANRDEKLPRKPVAITP